MSEDLGSVGISPAEKPSPSLASEVCEPSEDVLRGRLAKARKAVGKIQAQLSAAENARRASTPDCGRGKHDIEVTAGTVFTVYRCRRCPEEEWL